jgi:hypothetical protein
MSYSLHVAMPSLFLSVGRFTPSVGSVLRRRSLRVLHQGAKPGEIDAPPSGDVPEADYHKLDSGAGYLPLGNGQGAIGRDEALDEATAHVLRCGREIGEGRGRER